MRGDRIFPEPKRGPHQGKRWNKSALGNITEKFTSNNCLPVDLITQGMGSTILLP